MKKLALSTIAFATATPAFAHEQVVEHAHTGIGVLYAIPAGLIIAAAIIGFAFVLPRLKARRHK